MRRIFLSAVIAGSAAAAVVALAFGVNWLLHSGAPDPPGCEPQVAIVQVEEEFTWPATTGVDFSAALGEVSFEVPEVSLSLADESTGDASAALEWSIPTISFPTWEERSNEDDSQENSYNPTGGDDHRLCRRNLLAGSRRT